MTGRGDQNDQQLEDDNDQARANTRQNDLEGTSNAFNKPLKRRAGNHLTSSPEENSSDERNIDTALDNHPPQADTHPDDAPEVELKEEEALLSNDDVPMMEEEEDFDPTIEVI